MFRKEQNSGSILKEDTSLLVSEAYRMARTNLKFLAVNKGQKIFLFSSASPSEGKTTTCVNLAITFAETDKKVLIIDCDMRSPQLHRLFRTALNPGLSDFLGRFTDLSCIQKTDRKNISILTAGTIPPNPSELLVSPLFAEMIKQTSEQYDYVFLDAPPANLFADALSLTNQVDGVILVVKYLQTRSEVIRQTLEKFSKVDANVIGMILNGMDQKKYYQMLGSDKNRKYYSLYGYGKRH